MPLIQGSYNEKLNSQFIDILIQLEITHGFVGQIVYSKVGERYVVQIYIPNENLSRYLGISNEITLNLYTEVDKHFELYITSKDLSKIWKQLNLVVETSFNYIG